MQEDKIIPIEDNSSQKLIFETADSKNNEQSKIISMAPDWDIVPPFEINRGNDEL